MQPKAVFAHYDGTGAAGAFLPALKVISDGGETVGIYPTQIPIAAGGSAEVSWFPFVGGIVPAAPGQILQSYYGLAPAADFNFNSAVFVTSNFPTNTTFTKLSSTSAMQMMMLSDFTGPAGVPAVLFCGIFVDGVNAQTCGFHLSVGAAFATIANAGVWSTGRPGDPVLAAGAHTIAVNVATNPAGASTMRSSTSCQLSIIEYEP